VNEQDYIGRLKAENKILQDQLDKIQKGKQKKRKFRWWLFKKSSRPILGSRLKNSISSAITEYKEYKTVSVDTVSDVSSSIIWRITRIGLFAFLFAVLPSMVLIFQTLLLKNQNELVENQSDLVEAQRKSSLVFVMDNILEGLNEELKYKGLNSDNEISSPLEARIVGLSRAMKPYRYRENGELIDRKISPERGQLLYSLIRSGLGSQSLVDIFNAGDFEYSELKGVFLGRNVFLKNSILNYSNLTNAEIPEARLDNSELKDAEMKGINLTDASLKRVKLIRANLENAQLRGTDLTNTNLSAANLSGADLLGAKLWGAKLLDADLSDAILENVIVHRKDWISYISDSLDVKGADDIASTYRIKKQGEQQFVLVKK